MGRPICRPWPRRPRRRRSRGETGRRALLLAGLAGIAAALLVICAVNARVRPVAEELALAKLNNAVTAIVNQAVEETMASGAVSYSDIVTLQTDLSGSITAILTDPIKLNTLRTQLLGDLVEQVDSLDSKDLGIPLGNLTSLIPLSGHGPLLPVRVLAAAAPRASFRNAFQSAGINQTLHQVMLDVSVEVTLLLPGGTTSSVVSAQVCVAETVIVGQVPDAYLQFGGDGILTKE